jgi:aspartokinase
MKNVRAFFKLQASGSATGARLIVALISAKVVAVWDDVVDFFLEADPRFGESARGR